MEEQYRLKLEKYAKSPIFRYFPMKDDEDAYMFFSKGLNYAFIGLDHKDPQFSPKGVWLSKDYTCKDSHKTAIRRTEQDFEDLDSGRKGIRQFHDILDENGDSLYRYITEKTYDSNRWKRIERKRRETMFELLESSANVFGHKNELEIIFSAYVIEKLSYITTGPKDNGSSSLKESIISDAAGSGELADALNTQSNNPDHSGLALYQVILFVI